MFCVLSCFFLCYHLIERSPDTLTVEDLKHFRYMERVLKVDVFTDIRNDNYMTKILNKLFSFFRNLSDCFPRCHSFQELLPRNAS